MKRKKKLLILVAALIAVSLAAWGISVLTAPKTVSIGTDSNEVIFSMDHAESLSWVYEETEFRFQNNNGTWVYTPDESYVIGESYMDSILEALSKITAKKVIDQPQELAAYGLADPACTIIVDGATITIGSESALGSQRYVNVDDGKVYLVENTLLEPFTHSLLEMAALEAIPDLSTITALTITREDEALVLVSNPEDYADYTDTYSWFLKDEDGYTRSSQDVVEGLLDYLEDLKWLACEDYNARNLAAYGLDVPAATYQVSYETEDGAGTLTFLIGDGSDHGVYAMLSGSNMVYSIDETAGTVMARMTRESFYCTDVIRLDEKELESIEISLDGEACTVTKTTVTGTDDNGNETESAVWTLDETEVELGDILDGLTALVGENGSDVSTADLTAELTLTFHRADDSLTLVFYRYDSTHCVSVLNDEAPMLVTRSEVVNIKELLNTLILD